MVAQQPTYSFYTADHCGKLDEAAFNASLRCATSYAKDFIWPNEPDGSNEYMHAVCSAIDVDAAYGTSSGIGEAASDIKIGSFSISTPQNGDGTDYARDMRTAIKRELIGTGLLYMGIG
ncbi:MAG: hypothetical protein RR842_04015 [Gordonibacter sp.]|uniref:hypothetical protein n=1 Tax=Gordonibacter sp. TaxID=1968902 RepID=UPI002FCB6F9C